MPAAACLRMEYRIGSHSVRVDGDIVILTLSGDCPPAQVRRLLATIDEAGGDGPIYVLADVRGMKIVPPETRRLVGQWSGIGRIGGTAVLCSSVITQAIVMVVSRTSALLSKTKNIGEVSFCKSEEEGCAWLASRRSVVAAKLSAAQRSG